MLPVLRRLNFCRLSAFSRTRPASRASSATMGSALGTPAETQRHSTSSPIVAASASPSSSPSPSSPPYGLLESPATDRALLPKKTPLGAPLPRVIHAVLDAETEARLDKGRVIIIGDVHGCATELRELLAKVNFDNSGAASPGKKEGRNGADLLVFVGDLVNKGPDPVGTLELAMESGGVCVRGNHDEAAVALRHRMEKEGKEASAEAAAAVAAAGEQEKEKEKDKSKKKKKKDKAALLPVAELLTHMPWVADPRAAKGLAWLTEAPFSLRLGARRKVTVVHAGLVPNSDSSDSSSSGSGSAAAATSVESQRLEDLLEVRHVAKEFVVAGGGGAAAAAAAASTSRPSPSPSPSSSLPYNPWRAIDKKLAKQAEKQGSHASGLRVSLWAREYRSGSGGGDEKKNREQGGVEALSLSPPSAPPSPRSAGHVVFGHHASLGLQQEACATGIDTGCVLGGELTALVLGPVVSEKTPPSSSSCCSGWKNLPGGATLVSVKAKRAYVGKEAADAGAEEC